ncbi:MAG: LamG domain-containing protein [Myxococcota bacterium]
MQGRQLRWQRAVILGVARIGVAVLGLTAAASAQSWQIDYDPALGTLPSAQGFSHTLLDPAPSDGLSEANYSVAGGVLTQGDTGGATGDPANSQYYAITPPEFDFESDVIVIDLRLKILSSTTGSFGAGFGVRVRDGVEAFDAYFGEASVFLRGITGQGTHAFDTTAGFVDYQVRVDEVRASLRINGTEVTSLDRDKFRSNGSATAVHFGDLSTQDSGSAQIEHVRIRRFNVPAASVRNYETVTVVSATDSSSTKTLTASCPAGTHALGGGAATIGADGDVAITETRPTGGPPTTSWTGGAREIVDTSASWQLRVDVLCGEVSGYENLTQVFPQSIDALQGDGFHCPNGKVPLGGGGRTIGADLRQALVGSGWFVPLGSLDLAMGISAKDYGVATSSSAWGLEVEAICTDAIMLEPVRVESEQSPASPKDLSVNCPSGKVPIGGSAIVRGFSTGEAALRISRPKDDVLGGPPVGWTARAQVDTAPLWSLEVWALCAPIADPTVSKTGLVGRWKGDDAGDDSWDIGHGTPRNGVTYVPSFLGGQAFSLDAAADQWIEVPSYFGGALPNYELYPEASFSVEAWFQTDTLQPGDVSEIVNLYDLGGLNGAGANYSRWALRLRPEGFGSGFFADTVGVGRTEPPHGTADLSDGAPHHIVLVRDLEDRRARLYVDGVFSGENPISSMGNDGPLQPGSPFPDPMAIGLWRQGASTNLLRPFHGLIDDVKFYRRALDDEEIANTAGCTLPLVPRVLNLDAARFGSPADEDHGLCVFLEAGDYQLTLVSAAEDADARFLGWSPGPAALWGTAYAVRPELDPGFGTGLPVSASSAQQAFDGTSSKQVAFTLTQPQRVHFSLVEDQVLDNRGGVSIRLETLPEPDAGVLLVAGFALTRLLGRRREHQRSTRSG